MNEVSTTTLPEVCDDETAVARNILGDDFPLKGINAEPVRLSCADIGKRVRNMRHWRSVERIRAGLQQIANEIGLYRLGYDVGYEAGAAAVLEELYGSPLTVAARLEAIRSGDAEVIRGLLNPGEYAPSAECNATAPVTKPVITAHEQHVCRKPAGHQEDHRCWACTHTWPV